MQDKQGLSIICAAVAFEESQACARLLLFRLARLVLEIYKQERRLKLICVFVKACFDVLKNEEDFFASQISFKTSCHPIIFKSSI